MLLRNAAPHRWKMREDISGFLNTFSISEKTRTIVASDWQLNCNVERLKSPSLENLLGTGSESSLVASSTLAGIVAVVARGAARTAYSVQTSTLAVKIRRWPRATILFVPWLIVEHFQNYP